MSKKSDANGAESGKKLSFKEAQKLTKDNRRKAMTTAKKRNAAKKKSKKDPIVPIPVPTNANPE